MSEEGLQSDQNGLVRRFWRSIFKGPIVPVDDRQRRRAVLDFLILHIHPPTVPASTIRYTHTWGLGGMSLVLFLLLALTGILLMLVYRPVPMEAYGSILTLQDEVLFGKFIRSIHHWSANFLVIVALLHMLRVYFTGGFHKERQFNWVIGLCMFLLVVLANFTGYLLPWDQLAYWAITIMTSMLSYIPFVGMWFQGTIRGGSEIGIATLTNFFTLHTTIFPVLFVIFMPWHFWRVRKAGGVVLPRLDGEELSDKPDRVNTVPFLVTKELTAALVLLASVLVFSILFQAPLKEMANPGMSPNPAKAPWYFMGIQELLLHFHPLFAVFIIPVTAVLALVLIPYLKYGDDPSGVWFISDKGRRMATISALTAFVLTPLLVLLDEYLIDLTALMPGLPTEISNGLVPFLLVLAGLTGFYLVLKRRFTANKSEAVQTLFVFLLVTLVLLTIIGIWFRGQGMKLVWL
jgi:quinol-cytochrome oxidoreductase complex cytochrome b subunit